VGEIKDSDWSTNPVIGGRSTPDVVVVVEGAEDVLVELRTTWREGPPQAARREIKADKSKAATAPEPPEGRTSTSVDVTARYCRFCAP